MSQNNSASFERSRFHHVTLLVQIGAGFLISCLLHGTHGLECYDCQDTSPHLPGLPIPTNQDCSDPNASPGKVTKTTCTDPEITCLKGYGVGKIFLKEVKVLIRKCYTPDSKQKEPNGCMDFSGDVYGDGTIVHDKKLRDVMPRDMLDSLVNFVNKSNSDKIGEPKEGEDAKIGLPDHLHMKGKLCWCNIKDLCNDAAGFKVVDPNGTNVPAKGSCRVQIAKIPQLFFLFLITTTIATNQ